MSKLVNEDSNPIRDVYQIHAYIKMEIQLN